MEVHDDETNSFPQISGTSNAAEMNNQLEGNDGSCSIKVDDYSKEEEAFWNQQSIYKLHSFLKDKARNENIFEPLLVSIGPYHHGKEQLKPMEVHKGRARDHFIEKSHLPVEVYMDALKEDLKKIQESYEKLEEVYLNNPEKFIEMMVVDGCFILEFMDILSGASKDYAPNDPVFSYYGCIIHYNCVMRDMLLLENQLPNLVLEKLVSVSQLVPEHSVRSLSQMMLGVDMVPGRHLLDMYMTGLIEGPPEKEADQILPLSATKLMEAGIQFNKIRSFRDITYDEKRTTLDLPTLNINEYSMSTFMNLKAFELRGTTNRDFNSYIRLMDSLVKTVEDVKLLDSKRIIVNSLSDEAVVNLLKDLARDTVVDKNCKSYIARNAMTEHYKKITKQCKNEIRLQNYFRNPWSIISVVAAACLLVLTVLQTMYTVKSFYQGRPGNKGP